MPIQSKLNIIHSRKSAFISTTSVALLLAIVTFNSCKKFLQIDPPPDQITSEVAFTSDATATSVVIGMYSEMMSSSQKFSSGMTTLFAGLSADELYYFTPSFRDEFLTNQITETNHTNLSAYFWSESYKTIYNANLAIENLTKSGFLLSTTKDQLIGECQFIRAFCYFHLVNLFGDIPLITTPDSRHNAQEGRSDVKKIYELIISDLLEAGSKLPGANISAERTRPNKYAAKALLARAYLYSGNWLEAERISGEVINAGLYKLESNVENVFLKGSTETILQFQPVNPSFNTWEGNLILAGSNSDAPKFLLTKHLVNDFEPTDLRKLKWVGTRHFAGDTLYYPFKYKVFGNTSLKTEYYVILRLAEQYLIRAESRVRLSKLTEAASDLNMVRLRAGLPITLATDQQGLLKALEHERRIEFFAEWGHRWFDLKRTNRADLVLRPIKGATWQTEDILWPIPISEIKLNPQLRQNPGY